MPKIRIERYPVQTFKLGVLGFDHLQLVYQPDATPVGEAQDSWLLIEGLREWTADGVRLSVEGWEGRTTLAEANGGVFGYELTERIETPLSRGSRVVPVDGDAPNAWATMASFAGDIEAQGFPYIAFALPGSPIPTINSSSLISSLLYYIGVDIASVMPYGARLSPGTTTLIGSSGDDHLAIVTASRRSSAARAATFSRAAKRRVTSTSSMAERTTTGSPGRRGSTSCTVGSPVSPTRRTASIW